MKCCRFWCWLLIHPNIMMHQIIPVHWFGIFLMTFPYLSTVTTKAPPENPTQPPWPCVEEQGPVGSKMANMMTLRCFTCLSSPKLMKLVYTPHKIGVKGPTTGENVSRSRFDPTSTRFQKTLDVDIINLCTPPQKKKNSDEMSFENWLTGWSDSYGHHPSCTKPTTKQITWTWHDSNNLDQPKGRTVLHDSQGIHPMLSSYSSYGSPFLNQDVAIWLSYPTPTAMDLGEFSKMGKLMKNRQLHMISTTHSMSWFTCSLRNPSHVVPPTSVPTNLSTLVSAAPPCHLWAWAPWKKSLMRL